MRAERFLEIAITTTVAAPAAVGVVWLVLDAGDQLLGVRVPPRLELSAAVLVTAAAIWQALAHRRPARRPVLHPPEPAPQPDRGSLLLEMERLQRLRAAHGIDQETYERLRDEIVAKLRAPRA